MSDQMISERAQKLFGWACLMAFVLSVCTAAVAIPTDPAEVARTVADMKAMQVLAYVAVILSIGLVVVCGYLVRLLTGLIADTNRISQRVVDAIVHCEGVREVLHGVREVLRGERGKQGEQGEQGER